MKVKLNFQQVKKGLENAYKNQGVLIGVLDMGVKAASIDWSKGIRTVTDPNGNGTMPTRYVRRKGRAKNPTLRKVALILDAEKGIFSNVMLNPNNRDLINLIRELAVFDKTPQVKQRIERSARALVRNPLLRGDYGGNKKAWAERKGFSKWGTATGTLFKNIKARYIEW